MTNEILSPRTRVEARDSRKADPPTDKERFETGKELYVVSLAEKVWAETRVAVRADSMEEAARLALAGARYNNMEEWFIDYRQDLLDDTLLKEVSTTTQDDVDAEIALRLAESDERAISSWKEEQVAVGRFLEELEDSGFFSGEWGEGRVYEP